MYTVLVVLIVILAILMCLVVLIQESKGGGLASSFSASNQIMGVRKTTDVIEKVTWGLAAAMVVLSVVSVFFIPKVATEESAMMKAATEQKAVNSNNLPGFGASQPQQQAAPAKLRHSRHPRNKAEAGRLTTGGGAEAFLRIIKDRSTKEHKEGIDFRKRNLKN